MEELQVKYAPKKVFIIEESSYVELTYEEYCSRCEQNSEYENKLFLPMHGMLLEVSESDYKAFYKAQRRQKYLLEQSVENQDISMDMLATEEFLDRRVLTDTGEDVEDLVVRNLLLDKLRDSLSVLDEKELELIRLRYERDLSEKAIGEIYGVSQQAISKRLRKIYDKIKNLMEI